jgi:hypothetical protein
MGEFFLFFAYYYQIASNRRNYTFVAARVKVNSYPLVIIGQNNIFSLKNFTLLLVGCI